MIVHFEALNCLVALDYWVKRPLLQLLPIPAKIILGVRVEQEQEVFDIGDDFL